MGSSPHPSPAWWGRGLLCAHLGPLLPKSQQHPESTLPASAPPDLRSAPSPGLVGHVTQAGPAERPALAMGIA